MGDDNLPDIDLTVKWKPRFARRNLNIRQAGPSLPSLVEAMEKKTAVKNVLKLFQPTGSISSTVILKRKKKKKQKI